ncbi:triose-phosphate isomerase [Mycoplasmopsis cynos]|nr:triose-phosphate isomerase [Mycoplasmopsis cynos]WAM04423.1 triose-phosphate isomerase [Mycoplasmopsis cynos]
MNKKIIIGNWKMNKTFTETVEFLDKFSKIYREKSDLIAFNLNFGIAMPYTNLAAFKQNKVSDLKLSAQDVSMHNKGAYTRRSFNFNVKGFRCWICCSRHSERRTYHKETNELVNNKAKIALENGITPIICVGNIARIWKRFNKRSR